MSTSILGKLVARNLSTSGVLSAIGVTLIMLLLLTLFRLPVSLSNCTVGAFVGAALAQGSIVSSATMVEIIGSWIVVPFGCAFLSFVLYDLVLRIERSKPLVAVVRQNRIILAITVFFVSFMLGGNNLGVLESFTIIGSSSRLILDLIDLIIFGASTLGIVLFGKKLAEVVGEKIVGLSQIKTFSAMLAAAIIILILTLFSIPVSLTQVVIGGMLGAGVSRRPWVLNTREIGVLIVSWAVVTVVCVGLGYGLARIA